MCKKLAPLLLILSLVVGGCSTAPQPRSASLSQSVAAAPTRAEAVQGWTVGRYELPATTARQVHAWIKQAPAEKAQGGPKGLEPLLSKIENVALELGGKAYITPEAAIVAFPVDRLLTVRNMHLSKVCDNGEGDYVSMEPTPYGFEVAARLAELLAGRKDIHVITHVHGKYSTPFIQDRYGIYLAKIIWEVGRPPWHNVGYITCNPGGKDREVFFVFAPVSSLGI